MTFTFNHRRAKPIHTRKLNFKGQLVQERVCGNKPAYGLTLPIALPRRLMRSVNISTLDDFKYRSVSHAVPARSTKVYHSRDAEERSGMSSDGGKCTCGVQRAQLRQLTAKLQQQAHERALPRQRTAENSNAPPVGR